MGLHKYTRGAGGQDGVVKINMIDLVLVKKDIVRYMLDVQEVREMES